MPKEMKRVALGPDTDLRRVLEAVHEDKVPRLIERDGEALAIIVDAGAYQAELGERPEHDQMKRPALADERDIWAGYDARKFREALKKGAGALAGVDRDALLRDIREARQQNSEGRPE